MLHLQAQEQVQARGDAVQAALHQLVLRAQVQGRAQEQEWAQVQQVQLRLLDPCGQEQQAQAP